MPVLVELFLGTWGDQALCAGEELLRWDSGAGALGVCQPHCLAVPWINPAASCP